MEIILRLALRIKQGVGALPGIPLFLVLGPGVCAGPLG